MVVAPEVASQKWTAYNVGSWRLGNIPSLRGVRALSVGRVIEEIIVNQIIALFLRYETGEVVENHV